MSWQQLTVSYLGNEDSSAWRKLSAWALFGHFSDLSSSHASGVHCYLKVEGMGKTWEAGPKAPAAKTKGTSKPHPTLP